jgi:hypothetical protein
MSTTTTVIIVISVALPLIVTILMLRFAKKMGGAASGVLGGAFGGAGGRGGGLDPNVIQQLQQTGRKCRARLMMVRPTGLIINHINIGVDLTFQLEPLDGGAPFQGVKRATVNQTMMPRVGDVWPAWADPADPSKFMVVMPGGGDPGEVHIFRQFGIPHPLDAVTPPAPGAPMGAAPGMPGGAPMAPPPPGAPGAPSRLDELDRLSRLRAEGHITEAEFQREKARLLGG